MSKIRVEVSMVIDAPPEAIYAVISDYRVGHPAILPKPYFSDLTIEQGGQGAGTVIRFYVSFFGQEFHYHQQVTEPEPGRVLLETDMETGQFSRFTLDPLDDGKQTRVTIDSETPTSPGVKGFLEQLTQPPISRRLFRQELQQLADYVHHQS